MLTQGLPGDEWAGMGLTENGMPVIGKVECAGGAHSISFPVPRYPRRHHR